MGPMAAQDESVTGLSRRLQVGAWTVDPDSGLLTRGETSVRVRPKVIDLLLALARSPGELCSKQELLDRVWPDVVVSEASVSVLVVELRKALGDDPKSPRFVETIPRRGYRLIAPVSGAEALRAARFALASAKTRALLLEGDNLIGRAPEARVRIDSTLVSRRHSRIVVTGESVTIEDLGSKNGTFLNGKLLEGPEALSPGDEITIGRSAASYRFVVVDDEATVTEASKAGLTGQ